ncbi:hypothetical protein M408DRAFT_25987 [Serendipita vermifera MAFF 305830]|uniref:Uncharacterized protein n=1 Tax=Serendipita vermifera MAFF 305830 TaxID=933852 RepID=A0A0C3B0C9_SERVB|nr:hypothetical protein M408DRAFT_25987 [Serendipita vermifera MAFF 305830]
MSQQSRPYIPLQAMGDSTQYGDPYNNMPADTRSTLLGKDETQNYDRTALLSKLKGRTTSVFKDWGEKWDRSVERGLWPRVFYALFGAALLGLWLGLLSNLTDHESQYQNENYIALKDAVRISSQGRFVNDTKINAELWYLKGSLVQFDQKTRVLNVKWSLVWSQNGSDPKPFGTEDDHRVPVGLFQDQSLWKLTFVERAGFRVIVEETWRNLTGSNSTEFPDMVKPFDKYIIDNQEVEPVAILGMHSWDNAETNISLQHVVTGNAWMTPSIGFPFDRWTGTTGFVLSYQGPVVAFDTPGFFGTYLDDAYLEGSLLNWRVSANRVNTCTNSTSPSVNFTQSDPCELKIDFDVRRPGLVIFATIIAVTVYWLSTIFIFIMTCEGVIMRRTHVIQGPGLLAVCFTALFALPTVRSILPGAPDFGALIASPARFILIQSIWWGSCPM